MEKVIKKFTSFVKTFLFTIIIIGCSGIDLPKNKEKNLEVSKYGILIENQHIKPFNIKQFDGLVFYKNEIDPNLKYLVGPTTGIDTQIISQKYPNLKIFSASNDKKIVRKNIFLLGINPEDLVINSIDKISEKKINKFYLIAQKSKHNLNLIKFILDNAETKGYNINLIEKYTPKSFEYSIKSIATSMSYDKSNQALIVLSNAEELIKICNNLKSLGINLDETNIIGIGQYDNINKENEESVNEVYFSVPRNVFKDKISSIYSDGIEIMKQIKNGKLYKDEFNVITGNGKFHKNIFYRELEFKKFKDIKFLD